MTERLQKIISSAGIMSRRAAEGFIAAGRVTLNGVPPGLVTGRTLKLTGYSSTAKRAVDGEKIYIMLNKPGAMSPQ